MNNSGTLLATIISMRAIVLAIPDHNGRVAPLFDVASRFLITNSKSPDEKSYLEAASYSGLSKIDRLRETGVNVVICSAINMIYARALQSRGIDLVPGVIGEVDEIIDAFLNGRLNIDKFAMPGCAWRRRFRGKRCPYFREINSDENFKGRKQ